MSIASRGFGAAGAMAVLLTTSACGFFGSTGSTPPHVTEDQLVGHWRGDCGATMDVRGDHSFTVKDFAVEFEGAGTKPRLVSADGTWRLSRAIENVRPQELVLDLKDKIHRLPVGGESENVVLDLVVGDPDYAYECAFKAEPAT
ncbi:MULTISPECIES: hypothetical protein [Streptomyces]|uniref:hypothetical protein n=1 Tax=Streptomyces TaxID=1883 RepID=UPI001317490C|nr:MULTISPECIES: hypothetical protein [Streptomyces]QGZ47613.1 hypothetical protein GPZ77_03710 [Streptomyces sp. QHH-9511]